MIAAAVAAMLGTVMKVSRDVNYIHHDASRSFVGVGKDA